MQICLMYHDIYFHDVRESGFLRDRDFPYKMDAYMFEEHVRTISEYCSSHNMLKSQVVFTFDDGGKSFHSIIAPILEKYGYRGIFFVSSKYIGTTTFLDEDEILDLKNRGHIIGSHAHTHEHLYTLTDEQLDYEWKTSVDILERIIGTPVIYASIPNGDTSKRVLSSAYNSGIRYIYTSEPTTKVLRFNEMQIIGRYVLLSHNDSNYVMSVIKSSNKRMILLFKRRILKMIKYLLGKNYVRIKNFVFK